ncbi:cleft lip and palate transmembrane protein 1 isoform X3 [Gopherus evgoodei]|uniref:cleft lip and palate transmembrane protein 1 isoform X3 n=1 Tax=Gopherus evgoodei TaxID=1825980 RepID=UPI0011CFED9C|nr:cleft lip and palate transmembrane protein 1 isoform X3 [Gopherus evgoodei]
MAAPETQAALPGSGPEQVTSNGTVAGAPTAETQQQNQPQQQAPNAWQVIKGVLFRIFIIWAISSWFRRGPAPQDQSSAGGAPRVPSRNLFPKDTLMDLHVYISEHEHFTDFNVTSALFWEQRDLVYGDWTSGGFSPDAGYWAIEWSTDLESVQHNGSMYVHVFFTKSGFHPDPKQKNLYRRLATVHTSRMINKYKRRRFQKTKNLLTGETEADPEMIKRAEDFGPVEVISHWHPNLTINIVDDHTPWVKGSVPPPLDQYVKFDAVSGDYYPILYFNDYWNLQKDYFPINETAERLPFRLSFCPLSLWRWQLYAAQSTKSLWNFLGEDLYEQSDEEQDSVKVALLETNPYLLALTIIVSIVHSIFEFLAFKNDIQFWNSRQSLEGLSVRSVFFGVFQSLVVLLYILDNETNFVVQVSVFIGLLIDLWKITKVMDVRLDRDDKVAGIFPRLTFKDKSTYIESSTKVYDDMAFRYLSWILFPLLGCYAVYSLLYMEHKGWYSWVLSMLYGFLLTFGFITMTPQLFINYKLKSVAHLPWRMLTYKALNTFIDDLFAFVIKMPMMYRIGCLRDDVIFFIYLYQRWIYRVDLTRVNEFGISGEGQVPQLTQGTTPADCAPALLPDGEATSMQGVIKEGLADGSPAPVTENVVDGSPGAQMEKTAEDKKKD